MKTSESVKEVFGALVKFRTGLKQPLKDKTNPFFKAKYVPLENVVETIDNAIKGTGLSYLQEVEDGKVNTIITHESGEYLIIGGSEIKPVKEDPQSIGSAITYAKRYSLSCAFGVTSDEDDDGNSGSLGNSNKKSELNQPQAKAAKPKLTAENATSEDIERMAKKASSKYGASTEDIATWLKMKPTEAFVDILNYSKIQEEEKKSK